MIDSPSPNGSNGRDSNGRFTKGNRGGPGNPYARRVADFRRVLLEAVSDQDLHDIARTLVEKGKAGDVMAAREVLDRMLGKAKTTLAVEVEPMELGPMRMPGVRTLEGVEDSGNPLFGSGS